jgi:uncharacterized protein (DUF1684 family)
MINKIIQISLYLLCPLILSAQSFTESVEKFRVAYKAEFLSSSNSPLKKKDLKHLRFYPADSTYRVKATFTRTTDAQPFQIPTYSGIQKEFVQYGELHFELHGKPEKLAVYKSIATTQIAGYQDYLFLPFKDLTNGKESYGGGRYIDLKVGELSEGTYNLDFNRSYNPYCAYSSGYNCPIPPAVNHLKTKIEAGEKAYGKKAKHL